MKKITIVYHSGHGHTKVQAEAVARGVKLVPNTEVTLLTTEDAIQDMTPLNIADCIVFGSPTYMGGVSADFKKFIDEASRIWFKQGWKDKYAAGFTNSGGLSGDKLSTLMQLCINAMQHSMIWISTGLATHNEGDIQVNRLGSYLGAMAQSPQGAPEPIKDDIITSEKFGERIAKVVSEA